MVDFANSLSHKELNALSIDELNKLVLRKNWKNQRISSYIIAKFYQVANSEKSGPHPVSTSPFSIVNRAKIQNKRLRSLRKGRLEFKSVKEKVELFKSILKEIFSDVGSDEEFDQTFKLSMSNTLYNRKFKTISYNFRLTSSIKRLESWKLIPRLVLIRSTTYCWKIAFRIHKKSYYALS